ncbi:MAG: SgcJ/EcaC family oxidoreductase [Actinomycetota bacterium]|nr:SgcJ/EcaC family oxidoreductase [Actinomycetota bacterium]
MAGNSPEATDGLVEQAVGRQDLDALLDLFEADAVFVDPETGSELRGHDEIREAARALFELKPRIEGAPPKVVVAGDIALVLSTWTMEVTSPEGEASRWSGVATDVMRRQPDGTWRYVIDNPAGVAHAQYGLMR